MPRKPARIRDPNRSHAERKAPSAAQTLRNATPLGGPGWERFCLSAPTVEALSSALSKTPLHKLKWLNHSQPSWQKGSLPMKQHQKITSNREVGDLWRQVRDSVCHELDQKACPRCKISLREHARDTPVDLNKIVLGAALWPHQDTVVSPHGEVSAMVLVQKAELGGDFRIAHNSGEEGVTWRPMEDAATLRDRVRDTVSCDMRVGDCVLFQGCEYVHEVTRVHGPVDRLSMVLTLRCPRNA